MEKSLQLLPYFKSLNFTVNLETVHATNPLASQLVSLYDHIRHSLAPYRIRQRANELQSQAR